MQMAIGNPKHVETYSTQKTRESLSINAVQIRIDPKTAELSKVLRNILGATRIVTSELPGIKLRSINAGTDRIEIETNNNVHIVMPDNHRGN